LSTGHTGGMPLDTAHLSSLSTALDDLAQRITTLADEYQDSPREDAAADLYEVERHLQSASRRLHALLDKR
jgi:Mg2+ and Co2+ transporter CorA